MRLQNCGDIDIGFRSGYIIAVVKLQLTAVCPPPSLDLANTSVLIFPRPRICGVESTSYDTLAYVGAAE